MYIEESFDTIFNMGYGEGGVQRPPPMDNWSGKSAMDERVNIKQTLKGLQLC